MAKLSKNQVTTLEISDTQLILVQLENSSQGPHVKSIHRAPLPPRTVIDGEITDPEQLTEQIFSFFSSIGLKGCPLIVGSNDKQFVKRVDRMPEMPLEDIKAEVEIRVGNSIFYQQEAFQSDFIKPPKDAVPYAINPPIFYAGISRARVETLRTIIEGEGFQLAAVDILPLAILRLMTWQTPKVEEAQLYISIDANFIDLNICYDGYTLYTTTIRVDTVSGLKESREDFFEFMIQKVNLFLIGSSNLYPQAKAIDKATVFCRLPEREALLNTLEKTFDHIQFLEFVPQAKIPVDPKATIQDSEDPSTLMLAAGPAVGLALKILEEHQRSINLTKIRRSIGPVVDMSQLKKYVAIGLLAFVGLKGISMGFSMTAKRFQNTIKLTQDELRSLQTGDYLRQQKALKEIKKEVGFLTKISKSGKSNISFLQDIVNGMPNPLTLTQLVVSRQNQVTLKGYATSQDSIYMFYNHLQSLYKDITINGINSQERDNERRYVFEMEFVR